MHSWPHYILVFAFLWQIGVCPNYCSRHHGVEELFAGSDAADAHHRSHRHAERSEDFSVVSHEHDCDGTGRPAFLVSRTNALNRFVTCRTIDTLISTLSDNSLEAIRAFSSSRLSRSHDSSRESLRARSALQVWQV